ncbi:MAG: nucleoside monophosphate kinase [Cyclobacteriaceae bacterium]|jgi:adenylate kinase family enzyme
MRYYQIVYTDPHLDRELISRILSEGFDLKTFLLSDIFRTQYRTQNELTNEIKYYLDNGHVIPMQLTERIIEIEMDKTDKNILILGYPRSIELSCPEIG